MHAEKYSKVVPVRRTEVCQISGAPAGAIFTFRQHDYCYEQKN